MLARKFIARKALYAGALASAAAASAVAAATLSECESGPSLRDVISRLGRHASGVTASGSNSTLEFRSEIRGIKIYSVKDEAGHKAAGGLPVVRVAQTIIKAPVEDAARLWWAVNTRKEWDSVNTEDSQLVKAVDADQRLVYLQGKAKRGGVISSRDFAYNMYRVPAREVNARLGSVLFVQVNAANEVPTNSNSVRGDVNSLLLLEPIDSSTTKASYAIELDVKGWLPTKVVNAAADETPLTLAVMRDHLEGKSSAVPQQ